MSFGGKPADAGLPSFKSFVSEAELEEKKRVRQEEWEKVRKPDEPEEAPEEEYDSRCLYDQLQSQKDAKEAEYQEKIKLSNQVKGLEDDEVEFLDSVYQQQEDIEKAREKETKAALDEYKESMVNRVIPTSSLETVKKPAKAQVVGKPPKTSQVALLAGAIKRKSTDTENSCTKKANTGSNGSTSTTNIAGSSTSTNDGLGVATAAFRDIPGVTATNNHNCSDTARVVAILPGIGTYSDSDDSNSSDSSASEDEIDTALFRRKIVAHCQQ